MLIFRRTESVWVWSLGLKRSEPLNETVISYVPAEPTLPVALKPPVEFVNKCPTSVPFR